MLIGRFMVIVPVLAVAGSLANKRIVPASSGTLPTYGMLYILFLVSLIVIVGGLTYLPALSLGPLVEHFVIGAGTLY